MGAGVCGYSRLDNGAAAPGRRVRGECLEVVRVCAKVLSVSALLGTGFGLIGMPRPEPLAGNRGRTRGSMTLGLSQGLGALAVLEGAARRELTRCARSPIN